MDFDPAQVSYEELVRQFFAMHNPLSRPYSVQYRSAIFVHDAQQRATAEQVLKELEAQSSRMIYTAIEDAGEFYLAEDYHQKYYLKHDRIFAQELHRLFGDDEAKLIHSSVAARLSGLVGGYAPKSLSADSIDQLGLSDKARQHALDLLSGSARPQIMCR